MTKTIIEEYVEVGEEDHRNVYLVNYVDGCALWKAYKMIKYDGPIEEYLKKQGCKNIHFGEDVTFTKRRAK